MRFAMRLRHRVRANAVLVHRERHQRDAEPGGDVLDEGIGQRLDAAAAAARHHRRKCCSDALPAIRGEDQLIGGRRPVFAGEKLGGNDPRRLGACGGRVPQREIEHFGAFQPGKASGDHRRLRRQDRIVHFQIDARAARLNRRGDAAAGLARNERAASDFANHEAAAQQLGVDAARGGDGDLALIGKAALRRQAVAGLEPAIGDLGGDGIGKLQVLEF
jgi:hypothetical protein